VARGKKGPVKNGRQNLTGLKVVGRGKTIAGKKGVPGLPGILKGGLKRKGPLEVECGESGSGRVKGGKIE